MIHCQTLSIFCRGDWPGKKAIQTLIRFGISKAGKVARRQYSDRLNPASCSIEGTTKAGTIRGYELRTTMQLKLAIQETSPPKVHKSTSQYSIIVSCNKCAGVHEMGLSVRMENSPAGKQSIGDLYDGKSLPKNLANLS
jgi:hypothetical protein